MTPEKLDDIWYDRDFPVLREAARRIDEGAANVTREQLAEATGLDLETTSRAMNSLERAGLARLIRSGYGPLRISTITAEAQRRTGLYPDSEDLTERLLEQLQVAVDQSEGEQKTKLQKLLTSAADVPKSILSGIVVELIMRGGS